MRPAALAGVFALLAAPAYAGASIGIGPPLPEVESPVDERLFPPGPERAFILENCQGCHTLNLVARSGGDFEGWSSRLVRMIRAGAPITRAQIPSLAAYLAKAFPERPRPQPAKP